MFKKIRNKSNNLKICANFPAKDSSIINCYFLSRLGSQLYKLMQ